MGYQLPPSYASVALTAHDYDSEYGYFWLIQPIPSKIKDRYAFPKIKLAADAQKNVCVSIWFPNMQGTVPGAPLSVRPDQSTMYTPPGAPVNQYPSSGTRVVRYWPTGGSPADLIETVEMPPGDDPFPAVRGAT